MTEYIQVDRAQLRVGMRFDYRASRDIIDGVERTLTNLDPIEYDYKTSFGFGHAKLTEEDIEGRKFYVHPDDLHVDEPVEGGRGDWRTHDEQLSHVSAVRYEEGVRDGYLKAQREQGAKPTSEATRRDIRREDAVLWAIQALGGTPEAVHLLIPLAQQIERYVNGNDEQEAAGAKAIGFPDVIETDEQVALNWPEGTRIVDKDGDVHERMDGRWWWVKRADGQRRDQPIPMAVDETLRPARVLRVGTEAADRRLFG